MDIQERCKYLFNFNEITQKLENSRLAQRMAKRHYKGDIMKLRNGNWICVDGVGQEAIDAFVLKFRLLIQDRDGFSIQKHRKELYQPPAPQKLLSQLESITDQIKTYEDMEIAHVNPSTNQHFTKKSLFDTLFYGGLAHYDQKKVDLFKKITLDSNLYYVNGICMHFLITLNFYLNKIKEIRNLNNQLLKYWSNNSTD